MSSFHRRAFLLTPVLALLALSGPVIAAGATDASPAHYLHIDHAADHRLTATPAVRTLAASLIAAQGSCFDCVYIYEYKVGQQPVPGQLACHAPTNSFAGSKSPIIGPQTRKTTQAQRRWKKAFTVRAADCGASGYAVTGVRVDNPNIPVQIISATVNGHPVTTVDKFLPTVNSHPAVPIAPAQSSFSLAVVIQANSGRGFAGDLNIIVEVGPSAAAGSGPPHTAFTFGSLYDDVPNVPLSCNSSGRCTGSESASCLVTNPFTCATTESVVMKFTGSTETVTNTYRTSLTPSNDRTCHGSGKTQTGHSFPHATWARGIWTSCMATVYSYPTEGWTAQAT